MTIAVAAIAIANAATLAVIAIVLAKPAHCQAEVIKYLRMNE